MGVNKFSKLVLAGSLCLSATTANAQELITSFGSVKAGFANWDGGLENTGRGDLWKFMADYGAIYDTGEFYSFYEYNKLDYDVKDRN